MRATKATLISTLMLMGIATFLMGLMPSYAAIGAAAPILLAVLRIAQGVGVGGEWGGSVLLSMEWGKQYWRTAVSEFDQAVDRPMVTEAAGGGTGA